MRCRKTLVGFLSAKLLIISVITFEVIIDESCSNREIANDMYKTNFSSEKSDKNMDKVAFNIKINSVPKEEDPFDSFNQMSVSEIKGEK